jgi:hypothetical protein
MNCLCLLYSTELSQLLQGTLSNQTFLWVYQDQPSTLIQVLIFLPGILNILLIDCLLLIAQPQVFFAYPGLEQVAQLLKKIV